MKLRRSKLAITFAESTFRRAPICLHLPTADECFLCLVKDTETGTNPRKAFPSTSLALHDSTGAATRLFMTLECGIDHAVTGMQAKRLPDKNFLRILADRCTTVNLNAFTGERSVSLLRRNAARLHRTVINQHKGWW